MDYKELIKRLREENQSLSAYEDLTLAHVLEDAALAIETLLEERDAAVEELRGICWCCANGKPMGSIGRLRFCTTCDYMQERGILGNFGRERDCPHWQWRGPQREGGA